MAAGGSQALAAEAKDLGIGLTPVQFSGKRCGIEIA
jgi:hypothetical protein